MVAKDHRKGREAIEQDRTGPGVSGVHLRLQRLPQGSGAEGDQVRLQDLARSDRQSGLETNSDSSRLPSSCGSPRLVPNGGNSGHSSERGMTTTSLTPAAIADHIGAAWARYLS